MKGAGRRAALAAADIPTYGAARAVDAADGLRLVRAPGWVPRGQRVYAVGDVHGQRDRLAALHRLIAADLQARPVAQAVVVHLGDYIDQGPDSAGVVELLVASPTLSSKAGTGVPGVNLAVVNLLGDHERMLLDALDGDRAAATDWLWAGGKAALASWGLSPDLPREAWAAALPAAHLVWLRGLTLTHQVGDYLFVHAGLRPGVSLAAQARDDLLSIRQPFLTSEQGFAVVVVHGHSSMPAVQILANRIGLDTGAGIGGALSCAVLEEDAIGLLAV